MDWDVVVLQINKKLNENESEVDDCLEENVYINAVVVVFVGVCVVVI